MMSDHPEWRGAAMHNWHLLRPASALGNYAWLLLPMVIWAILGVVYILRGDGKLQHDLHWHVEYTMSIHRNGRLPQPYESWQTYQPPLYYLINQLACPSCGRHVAFVRLISVAYGAAFFFLCATAARWSGVSRAAILGSTSYLMTTPSVVQLFTSYNNDSLVITLSGIVLISLWGFLKNGKRGYLFMAFCGGALAVYAKYSAIYLLASVAIVSACGFIFKKVSLRQLVGVCGAACAPGIVLLPWLYFHNYHYTGKLFPHNVEAATGRIMTRAMVENNGGLLKFLFLPPGVSDARWTDPYAIQQGEKGDWRWTKKDFISSILVTSVIGEWDYTKVTRRNPRLTLAFGWLALGMRLAILAFVLVRWAPGMIPAVGVLVSALIAHVMHIAFVQPYVNAANFRYFAWVGIPFVVILSYALEGDGFGGDAAKMWGKSLILAGICMHIGFLLTVMI